MSESIDVYELSNWLRKHVVGERIVGHRQVDDDTEEITLSNGVALSIEGSADCCTWATISIGEIVDSQHVVTDVRSKDAPTDNPDDPRGSATIFLLTDAGEAARMKQTWDSGNGYYFGYHLNVRQLDGN